MDVRSRRHFPIPNRSKSDADALRIGEIGMFVATLEIARDNVDHHAITRLIDSAVADNSRRVPR